MTLPGWDLEVALSKLSSKGAAFASCWDESGDGMCVSREKHFQSLRVS